MRKRKGFTLIELLVVISIIALLLSILMPALSLVKQKAVAIACLANQRSLSYAWTSYGIDNGDAIVPGLCWSGAMKFGPYSGRDGSWVEPPQDETGNYLGNSGLDVTMEDRLRGLERGLLYSYLDSTEVFHCPGDTRYKKGTVLGSSDAYKIYRSYSLSDGATAVTFSSYEKYGYTRPTKVSQVKLPGMKHIFVEEVYDGYDVNYNDASWNLQPNLSAGSEAWWDPLGLYHTDSCTIGFADGHGEKYNYKDKRTIEYFGNRAAHPRLQPGNIDIQFFQKGWAGTQTGPKQ